MKMTQEQVEIIEKLANDGYADAIKALCDDCVEATINSYRKSTHQIAVIALVSSVIIGGLTTVAVDKIIKHFEKTKEESES